jgi:hypothetical protein
VGAVEAALDCTAAFDGLESLRSVLLETRAHLDEPMRVAIVGHIKAGKSTMLNALLGDEIAPTGTEELTFNVNWIRYGAEPTLRVHYKDGREPEQRTLAELEALTSRREENREMLLGIRYVELLQPIDLLRTFDLIDTPGLKSFFGQDSLNTIRFLGLTVDEIEDSTRAESAQADALLCLFTRSLAGSDQSIVRDFQGPLLSNATPINAIGVLTKADSYWDTSQPEQDPLAEGARVARIIEQEPEADRVFYSIVPVSGLLAFGSQTLTGRQLDVLEALSAVPETALMKYLKYAERFATSDSKDMPVPAEERAELLTRRLGQYGIWLAVRLLREGAGEEELRRELFRRSGVEALRDLVVSHFGHRALLIKTETGLRKGLDSARRARRDVDGEAERAAARAGGALEELEVSEPAFQEFALLRRYYRDRDSLALRDGESEELLRITGEHGTAIAPRLGLAADAPPGELVDEAKRRLAYWTERRDGFGASGDEMATARVMAVAYQRILFHAREARRHLELDP